MQKVRRQFKGVPKGTGVHTETISKVEWWEETGEEDTDLPFASENKSHELGHVRVD